MRTGNEEIYDVVINNSLPFKTNGRALEIEVEFEASEACEELGIKLFASPDNTEETILILNTKNKSFVLDRTKSSLSDKVHKSSLSGNFEFAEDGIVKVHLFIDHSSLEIFINYGACMSTRVYPTLKDSERVSLFSKGSVKINRAAVWELEVNAIQ